MEKKEFILKKLKNTYCRLQPSMISGVGVFAIRDIPQGINPFQGAQEPEWIEFSVEELKNLDKEIKKMIDDFYVIEKDGSVYIPECALDNMDVSFYVNHSTNPNLKKIDASGNYSIIESSIKKFGFEPEHNLHYFMNNEEPKTKNAIIDFGDSTIMLTNFGKDCARLFPSGILGPRKVHARMMLDFFNYSFKNKKTSEILAEISEDDYEEFKKIIPKNICLADAPYIYYWPIVNLKEFDMELKGSRFYELRKIKYSFMKKNRIEFHDAKYIEKGILKEVLHQWEKSRKGKDDAISHEYNRWLETNFLGADYAKCAYVNGFPSAILCGWNIPNSNSFYLAVVLHNYMASNIGEILYLECFKELKSMGFGYCNLGGSDENLLKFKKKFLPEIVYKTVEFSVKRA